MHIEDQMGRSGSKLSSMLLYNNIVSPLSFINETKTLNSQCHCSPKNIELIMGSSKLYCHGTQIKGDRGREEVLPIWITSSSLTFHSFSIPKLPGLTLT